LHTERNPEICFYFLFKKKSKCIGAHDECKWQYFSFKVQALTFWEIREEEDEILELQSSIREKRDILRNTDDLISQLRTFSKNPSEFLFFFILKFILGEQYILPEVSHMIPTFLQVADDKIFFNVPNDEKIESSGLLYALQGPST